MKQKMVVILLGLAILLGISISLYLSFGSKGSVKKADPVATQTPSSSVQPENTEETNISIGGDTKKPEVEPKPSVPTKIEDLYEKPKETEKTSISATDAKALEAKVRSSFRKFEFEEGLNQLQTVIGTIKNEGNGAILYQLNDEGSMLQNLLPAAEEEEVSEMIDTTGITNMLASIKDPENKLIGTLLLNDRLRVDFIVDQASLNPLFDGSIRIADTKEITSGDELNKIRYVYENADHLVRVDFSIEGNSLYAYVLYFPDGTSKLFGIYSDNNAKYKTVSEWKKFYEAIYQ